jgi:hypothetical protein
MEDKFTERFDFYGTPEHKRRVKALADANYISVSDVLRALIDRSYSAPKKYGFFPPEKKGDK